MASISDDFIQRCRNEYMNLTRLEGADYFETLEAENRAVNVARQCLQSEIAHARQNPDAKPQLIHKFTQIAEADFHAWMQERSGEQDNPGLARKRAAMSLARCRTQVRLNAEEVIDYIDGLRFVREPLSHLLLLCQGRKYPHSLFWRDLLVENLHGFTGWAYRQARLGHEREQVLQRFWSEVSAMDSSSMRLPYMGTIAKMSRQEDFIDGVHVLTESFGLIHRLGVERAMRPPMAVDSRESRSGRQLQLVEFGPARRITNHLLYIYAVLCEVRYFLHEATANEQNRMLAIGFLATRNREYDCSLLVASIDTLLGQTDVAYDGLMKEDPHCYSDDPMHRYGRARAQALSVEEELDAGLRFVAKAEEYFASLRLHSGDVLATRLEDIRESACILAALDADL